MTACREQIEARALTDARRLFREGKKISEIDEAALSEKACRDLGVPHDGNPPDWSWLDYENTFMREFLDLHDAAKNN
jgi:hypothetical protein